MPVIELLNSRNVPDKKVSELKMELNELAKQLLGEVSVACILFKLVCANPDLH